MKALYFFFVMLILAGCDKISVTAADSKDIAGNGTTIYISNSAGLTFSSEPRLDETKTDGARKYRVIRFVTNDKPEDIDEQLSAVLADLGYTRRVESFSEDSYRISYRGERGDSLLTRVSSSIKPGLERETVLVISWYLFD